MKLSETKASVKLGSLLPSSGETEDQAGGKIKSIFHLDGKYKIMLVFDTNMFFVFNTLFVMLNIHEEGKRFTADELKYR